MFSIYIIHQANCTSDIYFCIFVFVAWLNAYQGRGDYTNAATSVCSDLIYRTLQPQGRLTQSVFGNAPLCLFIRIRTISSACCLPIKPAPSGKRQRAFLCDREFSDNCCKLKSACRNFCAPGRVSNVRQCNNMLRRRSKRYPLTFATFCLPRLSHVRNHAR